MSVCVRLLAWRRCNKDEPRLHQMRPWLSPPSCSRVDEERRFVVVAFCTDWEATREVTSGDRSIDRWLNGGKNDTSIVAVTMSRSGCALIQHAEQKRKEEVCRGERGGGRGWGQSVSVRGVQAGCEDIVMRARSEADIMRFKM